MLRNIFIALSLSTLSCLAFGPSPAPGGSGVSTSYVLSQRLAFDIANLRIFYATNYGVVPNITNDQTAAVQAAIDAAAPAGTVIMPQGVVYIDGSYYSRPATNGWQADNFNCQLHLPQIFLGSNAPGTIVIRGVVPCQFGEAFPVGQGYVAATNYSTIASHRNDAGGQGQSMFGSGSCSGTPDLDGFNSTVNGCKLVIENINFVVPPVPQVYLINAHYLSGIDVNHCMLDARDPAVTDILSMAEPLGGGIGCYLPVGNNWCDVSFKHNIVLGWSVGIRAGENADVEDNKIEANEIGVSLAPGYCLSDFRHNIFADNHQNYAWLLCGLWTQSTVFGDSPDANGRFSLPIRLESNHIQHDHYPNVPTWQVTANDLYDPTNNLGGMASFVMTEQGMSTNNWLSNRTNSNTFPVTAIQYGSTVGGPLVFLETNITTSLPVVTNSTVITPAMSLYLPVGTYWVNYSAIAFTQSNGVAGTQEQFVFTGGSYTEGPGNFFIYQVIGTNDGAGAVNSFYNQQPYMQGPNLGLNLFGGLMLNAGGGSIMVVGQGEITVTSPGTLNLEMASYTAVPGNAVRVGRGSYIHATKVK